MKVTKNRSGIQEWTIQRHYILVLSLLLDRGNVLIQVTA